MRDSEASPGFRRYSHLPVGLKGSCNGLKEEFFLHIERAVVYSE